MRINFKKILLLLFTIILIIFIGVSFVLPRVFVKLSREISRSTAADFGMRYDKIEILSDDSLLLKGDFIYPFHRNYNEETSSHSVIILHPLKYNTRIIYPLAKSLTTLDVNFISFDSRGHGRSEGHQFTLGVKEAEDISKIIDYILSIYPNHSFGIYARYNTGNIALKAMQRDKRIMYGILENYDEHPLKTLEKMNFDDVFIKQPFIKNYVLKQTINHLDLEENETAINYNELDVPLLFLTTDRNKKEFNILKSRLTNSELYSMYFPENEWLQIGLNQKDNSYQLKDCLVDFIESQSVQAIEKSKELYFTPDAENEDYSSSDL